jgi:hypothetical protein
MTKLTILGAIYLRKNTNIAGATQQPIRYEQTISVETTLFMFKQ